MKKYKIGKAIKTRTWYVETPWGNCNFTDSLEHALQIFKDICFG